MMKSRKLKWDGHVSRTRKIVGNPDVDGRIKVKIDLTERGCKGVDWVYLAQDRSGSRVVVNTLMSLCVS